MNAWWGRGPPRPPAPSCGSVAACRLFLGRSRQHQVAFPYPVTLSGSDEGACEFWSSTELAMGAPALRPCSRAGPWQAVETGLASDHRVCAKSRSKTSRETVRPDHRTDRVLLASPYASFRSTRICPCSPACRLAGVTNWMACVEAPRCTASRILRPSPEASSKPPKAATG